MRELQRGFILFLLFRPGQDCQLGVPLLGKIRGDEQRLLRLGSAIEGKQRVAEG